MTRNTLHDACESRCNQMALYLMIYPIDTFNFHGVKRLVLFDLFKVLFNVPAFSVESDDGVRIPVISEVCYEAKRLLEMYHTCVLYCRFS